MNACLARGGKKTQQKEDDDKALNFYPWFDFFFGGVRVRNIQLQERLGGRCGSSALCISTCKFSV